MPTLTLGDVLNELHHYEHVAFRLALRRDEHGGWLLHTLVVDAIPEEYRRKLATFNVRYNMAKFPPHIYPTAVFIADILESSRVISWFDQAHDFSIPTSNDPGTSTKAATTRMPMLQEQPSAQTFYYRTAQNDGLDLMRWPHTTYTFHRTSSISEQNDDTRLVATESGIRSFSNFREALITLIYGVKDWNQAQRLIPSPTIVVRIVKEKPFFFDIRQDDKRHVTVSVRGPHMLNTVIQLNASGDVFVEQDVHDADTYQFELKQDVPQKGRLTLIQGGELLDEYEWDSAYAPLPGAPESAPLVPTFPSPVRPFEYPFEVGDFISPGETVTVGQQEASTEDVPPAIRESLAKFRNDHPDSQKTGFIMMHLGDTEAHNSIAQAIKQALNSHGLTAVRADDKEYHENTYENIQTYMHGCGFGIAVFERLESEAFNPNVALEVGYMKAMKKPVCLLKDKTLKTLQADLLGKLYRPFDPQQIQKTIQRELDKWLRDYSLLSTNR